MRWAVLALLVGACAGDHPRLHANRVVWTHAPRIGSEEPAAESAIRAAIEAWGFGKFVNGCLSADICVRLVDDLDEKYNGMAEWDPAMKGRGVACWADVMFLNDVIVTHEVGHCFGLNHSKSPLSYMYRTPQVHRGLYVFPEELEALDVVKSYLE